MVRMFSSDALTCASLAVESAELLQLMQWWKGEELECVVREKRGHLTDELADVLHVLLLLAEHAEIDLAKAFEQKMKKNRAKYPIEKARGSAKKYTERSGW